jgi:predicted acetyltransferase
MDGSILHQKGFMMRSAASSLKAANGPGAAAVTRISVTAHSGRRANSSNRSKRNNACSISARAAKPSDRRESENGKSKSVKASIKADRKSSSDVRSRTGRKSASQNGSARLDPAMARRNRERGQIVETTKRARLGDSLREPLSQDVFSEAVAPGELRLVLGRSGDHAAVYHTLLAIFQNPSREEFHAQTEDPFYEPNDRLLVKRGYRVLSHLQLTHRTLLFGNLALPVAGIHWLGTLPEFRNQGFASRLLQEADRRMVAAGAVLGMTRTNVPHFFRRAGWALSGRHSFSQAKARDVLGRLHSEGAAWQTKPLNIRLWRHVEMPALMRIYRQNTQSGYGPLERTEAYWRWLVGRKAFDALLVALDGPDKLELEETIAPIVGYAVLRQERVVELFAAPNHPTAAQQLLARACSDIVEHDRQELFLHAPPNHELHKILTATGGTSCRQEMAQNEVFMMKIIDPLKFLNLLASEFEARAKSAGLPRGTELGLQVDDAKWRLVYSRHGFRVRQGKLGRSYLTLNRAEFTRLALGHGRVQDAAFAGRIQNSTRSALDLADILFPQLPFWRPSWDELPV